jgi:hypothetical protein
MESIETVREAVTADLVAHLPELEREAAEHEAQARALRQIIAGVQALNGRATDLTQPVFHEQNGTLFVAQALDPSGPRGQVAVLKVMFERPTHLWKVVELKRELLRRGWAPSPKAVEATLKRMLKRGDVRSPRYGYYTLARGAGADA